MARREEAYPRDQKDARDGQDPGRVRPPREVGELGGRGGVHAP